MKRRTVLQAAGAATAGGILGLSPSLSFSAQNQTAVQAGEPPVGFRPLKTESNDLAPYAGAWTDDTLRHLLRRSMFGVPQSQFDAAKALGSMSVVIDKLLEEANTTAHPLTELVPSGTVNWLIDWNPPNQRDPKYANDQAAYLRDAINFNQQQHARILQIMNWWFDTMMNQPISLREKMALLWTNHFVVGSETVEFASLIYSYLQLCRKFSLGNFRTFTHDMSIEPAMLMYLNGDQNYVDGRKSHINENFGRELLELFTLGILDPKTGQPNYTETDIQNAARALSGWLWYNPDSTDHSKPPFSAFFVPTRFDSGTKSFFGKNGNLGLQDVLDAVFEKNGGYNVAYFVSQKIYQEFVYYVPNATVVDAMANVMVANNFEIAPVMRALLSSAHFYDANVIGAQLKSPVEFFGSLVREMMVTYPPVDLTDPIAKENLRMQGYKSFVDPNPSVTIINTLMAQQGQQLLSPPNVKGWPGGHNWISTGTFQNREGYSYILLNNILDNYTDPNTKITYHLKFDPDGYAEQIGNARSVSAEALSTALENISSTFIFGPQEGGDLDTLLQGVYPNPNYQYNTGGVKNFAITLALLPEFQLL